jgi:hypothetical protein
MGITQQIGASSLIKPGVIDNTAARPASPYEGQVIFQKDTDQLLVWNGTAWVIPNSPAQNPTGLEYITQFSTSSGTSVTSPTVFSSTYANYKIVISNMESSSPGGGYYLTMGSSSSGSNHYMGGFYVNLGASTMTTIARNGSASWIIGTGNTGQKFSTSFDICSPNLAAVTNLPVANMYAEQGFIGVGAGLQYSTTQFTTFTLSSAGATFSSGTVRVYGYRNS